MKKLKHKLGFTIAELTIAIMLIGGIAMVLMPTLVNDNEKQIFATALKKTYAELQQTNQAIGLLLARGEIRQGTPIDTFWSAIPLTMKVLPDAKTIAAYSNIGYIPNTDPEVMNDTGTALAADTSIIVLKNGVFLFKDSANNIVVDVNGRKQPNTTGKDIYYFTITQDIDNSFILSPLTTPCPARNSNNECAIASDCKGCANRIINETGRIDWY